MPGNSIEDMIRTDEFVLRVGFLQVHSAWQGVHHKGTSKYCWKAERFLIWKNYDYGIYSWPDKSIVVTDSVFVDNKISLSLQVFGPNPVAHQSKDNKITVKDSLFVGMSDTFDCTQDTTEPWHVQKSPNSHGSRPPGGKTVKLQKPELSEVLQNCLSGCGNLLFCPCFATVILTQIINLVFQTK